MEYTKGEWKPRHSILDKRQILITADDKVDVAVVRYEIKESKTNAYLIAAAPNMYEALKLYQSHQQNTSGHYCWQCAEAINKALAKAEGK